MCKVHALQGQKTQGGQVSGLQDWLRDSTATTRSSVNETIPNAADTAVAEEARRLRAQLSRLEAEREASSKEQADAADELASLQATESRQRTELEALRKELASVGAESNWKIDEANARIRAMRKEREDAIQELTRVKAETQGTAVLADGLKEKDASRQAELQDLRQQREQAMQEVTLLRQQHAVATQRVSLLEGKFHEQTLELAKHQDELNSTTAAVKINERRDVEARNMEARDAQQKKDLEQLSNRVAQLETISSEQRDVCNEQQRELRSLRSTAERHKAEQAELQQQVEQRQAEVERLRGQLQQMESGGEKASALEITCDSQRQELSLLRAAKDQHRSQVEGLQQELDELSQEANSKIDAANERIRKLQRDKDEGAREIERLTTARASLTKDLEAERTRRRESEEKLRAAEQAAEEKLREAEVLQRNLDELCKEGHHQLGSATEQVRAIQQERRREKDET